MGVHKLRSSLPLIQEVLSDPTRRDRLSELDLPLQVKAYLALTVMLVHSTEFLDNDNQLLVPLNATLMSLAGGGARCAKDRLGSYCRNAGLYRSARTRPGKKRNTRPHTVTLTPSPEVLAMVDTIKPWRPPVPRADAPLRYTLTELLAMIDEPIRSICQQLIADNHDRFYAAAGSTRIHQNWPGGLLDHLVEVMNFTVLYYRMHEPLGRFALLPPEQQFTLSDALVVIFWRNPKATVRYGVKLTAAMENALEYIQGIRDGKYTPDDPLMGPLAIFCHMCDLTSVYLYPTHPLAENEPWGNRGHS